MTNNIKQIIAANLERTREELQNNSGLQIKLKGRIIAIRCAGKSFFLQLMNSTGQIQLYANNKLLNEANFSVLKALKIGDIVSISGTIFKTKTNELTIKCCEVILLVKTERNFPDKYHGLQNPELIYRERHVDLLINKKSRERFIARSKIIFLIRDFLNDRKFVEVDTPVLQPIYGGAFARPFITKHNTLNDNFYLRIATEIYLKKIIIGGFDKVFEIGRLFRNEGIDSTHNPEFTMMELYEAYGDLNSIAKLTKDLIQHLVQSVHGKQAIKYLDKVIDFSDKSWKMISMKDLVKEKTGIDFDKILDFDEAKTLAKQHSIKLEKFWDSKNYVLNKLFEKYVEESLINPTFVCDFPVEISPFAKVNSEDERFCQRFELFIGGKELGNAFNELNDAEEQLKRFQKQQENKAKGDIEATDIDYDFIEALKLGMPPTGGIGIGIDRLIMLLTDARSIKNVILFPTLKRKANAK